MVLYCVSFCNLHFLLNIAFHIYLEWGQDTHFFFMVFKLWLVTRAESSFYTDTYSPKKAFVAPKLLRHFNLAFYH